MEIETGILRRRSADWPVLDAVGSHTLKAIVAARAFLTNAVPGQEHCMEKLEITRNAQTDQFSVVLSRGNDTIRCMVTVETSRASSNEEKHRAALSKAKALAKALDTAIDDT
jgi:hypothetical protein